MDIIKALEMLKKVELKLQELYAYYHKLNHSDKKAAGLFYELSLEEKSHADLIDYQLRTIKKNRSLFKDVEFDLESLIQFIARMEDHIISEEPLSLDGALKFGIELEDNILEYYYRTLITESNPELGELIKKLGSSEKGHSDKLKYLAENRGYLA